MNVTKFNFKIFKTQYLLNFYEVAAKKAHGVAGSTLGPGLSKSGGTGGGVKEGEGLGKFGAAREDGYFYDKQREQLQLLKNKMDREKKVGDEAQKKAE